MEIAPRGAARHFRDDLRAARQAILADAEAYARPLHALERLGRYLKPDAKGLHAAEDRLLDLVSGSPLGSALPSKWPELHRSPASLLALVRQARNDAMHTGAYARYLTRHAIELCLALEDALEIGLSLVGDFMVSGPTVSERWQPVSHVRQLMLTNSFSFIPLAPGTKRGRWRLVADCDVARYLRGISNSQRGSRLSQSVENAMRNGLETHSVRVVPVDAPVADVIGTMNDHPVLVSSPRAGIVGILTAFDLL